MSVPKSSPREPLSRARVVEHTLATASAHGLEAVTIRRLATDLGVTPMALYWHFATKDDLLASAADRLLDAVVLPERTADWGEDLRALINALVTATRPHPQVAPLVTRQFLVHPVGLDLSERALADLDRAGFDPDQASALAVQVLRSTIAMVTAEQVVVNGRTDEERAEALRAKRARLATLPPDRYPTLVSHAHAIAGCDAPTYLDASVDLIVAGIRALAPTHEAARTLAPTAAS